MKTLLIDAIVGVGFPSTLLSEEAVRVGMARYTGNQHVWGYEWLRERLERCEEPQLQALYQGLREARDEATQPKTPESVIIHAH